MALEAKNIYFRYSRSSPYVIENSSITVERGKCTALYASSGYGKTTLAKIMAGYLKPDSGEVLCDSSPLPEKGICPVQLIFQHPEKAVNPRWKLKKVLSESGQTDENLLDALCIERHWLERYPSELSGGELQRFCVARAILSGCSYLICDEISTMLDAITRAQIWNAVLSEAEKRNMGILAITHDMKLAQRIADKIITPEK